MSRDGHFFLGGGGWVLVLILFSSSPSLTASVFVGFDLLCRMALVPSRLNPALSARAATGLWIDFASAYGCGLDLGFLSICGPVGRGNFLDFVARYATYD